jgi:hypothetical protein
MGETEHGSIAVLEVLDCYREYWGKIRGSSDAVKL